jgi:hypothetical protein
MSCYGLGDVLMTRTRLLNRKCQVSSEKVDVASLALSLYVAFRYSSQFHRSPVDEVSGDTQWHKEAGRW